MMITRANIMRLAALATVHLAVGAGCASYGRPDGPSAYDPPPANPEAQAQAEIAPAGEAPPAAINHAGMLGQFARTAAPPTAAPEYALQQHTASDDGQDADVAVDPAGKWIAFASTRHSDRSDIYLQKVGGVSVIQLTGDPADDAQPAFSPDGQRIAFCSNRAGNWDIYITDTAGKNVQQVTGATAHEMHPSFSPDGSRLVYCALSPRSSQWELWTIDLKTQERRMIGQGLFPVWSPQKGVDRIAFQRARQRGGRWFSVWTLDLVNNEPTRLTEVAVSSNAAVICPSWSADGGKLAFVTVVTDGRESRQDVWIADADGANRHRLTDGSTTNLSPCWAVDNRVYFISDRGGNENVWSTRAESRTTSTAAGSAPVAPAATAGTHD